MAVRGIRGATVVATDRPDLIRAATTELLQAVARENQIVPDDVVSVIFTVTPDLRSEYPARAAREMGWTAVALLGAIEMAVPGGLERCIRLLMHVNTDRPAAALRHVYLGAAHALRPDR